MSIPLHLDDVFGRYWQEVGQHRHGFTGYIFDQLGRLIDFFGPATLITDIRDADIARLTASYRGLHPSAPSIAVRLLRMVFTRCKRAWGVRFEAEPDWRRHINEPEPTEDDLVEAMQQFSQRTTPKEARIRAEWRTFWSVIDPEHGAAQ